MSMLSLPLLAIALLRPDASEARHGSKSNMATCVLGNEHNAPVIIDMTAPLHHHKHYSNSAVGDEHQTSVENVAEHARREQQERTSPDDVGAQVLAPRATDNISSGHCHPSAVSTFLTGTQTTTASPRSARSPRGRYTLTIREN